MGVLVLASGAGAPGTTTTAVGLTLAWPRSVLLIDADPGAHQAVLAGFLAGRGTDGKGLLRVAEAHRDRRPLRDVVVDQTLELASGGEHSRRFLPGFVRPGAAGLFSGVWPELMAVVAELAESDVDVIIDLGRLAGQIPAPVAESAQQIAIVLRSSLRSIVSVRVNLTPLREQLGAAVQSTLGLIVVGPGEPYAAREIQQSLQLPCLTTLADDPAAAAHLSDGRPRPRRFDSSPLIRSLQTAAVELSGRITQPGLTAGAPRG